MRYKEVPGRWWVR